MSSSGRLESFRFPVDRLAAGLTPLAAVEVYLGPKKLKVLNISEGGMAVQFDGDDEAPYDIGDILDVSVVVRERAFPVRIELRNVVGPRLHCRFDEPSESFQHTLRDFFGPKALGRSLERCVELQDDPEALALVPGATHYLCEIGENQCGLFAWEDQVGKLMGILCVCHDSLLAWDREAGLRTGRLRNDWAWTGGSSKLLISEDAISWNKEPTETVVHFFADFLLSRRSGDDGRAFVESLLGPKESALDLRLPP